MWISHLERQQCNHRKYTPNNVWIWIWIIKENPNECTSFQSPRILPLTVSALLLYFAIQLSHPRIVKYFQRFKRPFFDILHLSDPLCSMNLNSILCFFISFSSAFMFLHSLTNWEFSFILLLVSFDKKTLTSRMPGFDFGVFSIAVEYELQCK